MKSKKKGGLTLAEHDELLKAEGKYDEMIRRHETLAAERQQRVAEYRRAEKPLIEDLRSVGYEVESAWDLVNTSSPYPEALPVLLDHLSRDYPDAVREGIARSLGVPKAKFGWEVLKRHFLKEKAKRVKDGLAVALGLVADRELLGELIELVRDPRNGSSRILMLRTLSRTRDPRGLQTLIEMADDPDLEKEIAIILKRKRKREANCA